MKAQLSLALLLSFTTVTALLPNRCESQPSSKDETVRFDNAPLSEVTKKLSSWYDVRIVMDHKDIADMPLTCRFSKDKGLSSAVRTIEYVMGLKSYYKGGVLHLVNDLH